MGRASITIRERVRGVRVLVVHDESQDLTLLCDLLKKELVVREAATIDEAVGRLREMSFACVVCAVGGGVRGQEFLAAVSNASAPADARYVVFVVQNQAVVYSRRDGSEWTREPTVPDELQPIARAVETVLEPLSAVHSRP
jgi:hypothetical protein